MTFVNFLVGKLINGFNFVGDMLYKFISFLAKPLSYVYYFFDGVFYFVMQLALVVWKIISLFVALFQFFGALVAGFFRTITSFLAIDFTSSPVHFPSSSLRGLQVILNLIAPMGLLSVLPLVLIAVVWFIFVKRMIGLLGGDIKGDA